MIMRTKVLAATAATLVVVLGGAGTAYAVQHQDRALSHTSIAGMDVSGESLAEITDAVRAKADGVRLTLVTPQGSKTASLADLGYTVDAAATAHQVLEGRSLSTYARALVSDADLDLVVSSDPATLRTYADGLVPAARTQPKNAAVRLAADKRSFAVVPAVTGASIEPEAIEAAAAASARDLTARTVQVTLRDVTPAVTTETAQALATKANALVSSPVKVSLAGATSARRRRSASRGSRSRRTPLAHRPSTGPRSLPGSAPARPLPRSPRSTAPGSSPAPAPSCGSTRARSTAARSPTPRPSRRCSPPR